MAQIIDVPGQGPVEFPDEMTDEQIAAVLRQQMQPSAPAKTPREQWQEELRRNVEEMPTSERLLAGTGKAFVDLARGTKQLLNIGDQDALKAEIEAVREMEAPLMQTGAGVAGNVLGNVAALAPAAFIPGVNTMAGAAALGAASGAIQPTVSDAEALANVAAGGLLAPAGVLAGRGVSAGGGLVRGLLEPLTERGQERIAQRVFTQFAGGGDKAREAAANIRSAADLNIPGYQPTAAELANNPGLAQLQRTLAANPEATTAITERAQANRGALLQALQGVAGDEQQMAAAVAAREAAAGPLYAASRAQPILPDAQFMELAQRPAMQQAMKRAEALTAETGRQPTPGEFMHAVKMSLDDMLETAPQQGIGKAEANSIRATRGEFIDWLEQASPEYGAARVAYREGTQPISQMQFGRELINRFQPALADFGADTRTTAATYAQALRNADQTARKATGFSGQTMRGLLTPQAEETVTNVGRALGRKAKSEELGRIPGSPTAQNLISQNLIQQVAGPLGMPQTIGQGVLAQTLARPAQWAGRLAEPRVVRRLAEIGLSPDDAARILEQSADPDLALDFLLRNQSLLAPAALGAGYGAQ